MRFKFALVTGLIVFSPICPVFASSFSQLVVFGDSLSDNGNLNTLSQGLFPGKNYGVDPFTGAQVYSDGPNTSPTAAGPAAGLWVDQLSRKLGVADPQPSVAGGTNYAFGGAETGSVTPVIDMGHQLAAYTIAHPTGASSTGLYALWGGANDIIDGRSPTQAADNIRGYIHDLSAEGAKNFVWLNLPLLGDTPDGSVAKAQLNAASVAFDTEWAADLALLQGQGINVVGVDIEKLFTNLIGNPGAYGLSNVTDRAQTSGLANDAGYLFWDGKHPTTQGHALVADDVYSSLTPTPEPASAALAVIGMLAVAGFSIRKRNSKTT